MKKSRMLLLVICIIYLDCFPKKEQRVKTDDSLSTMKIKALSGDTIEYEKLETLYMDSNNLIEFLPYALLMANKYDYPRAYYDVFEKLVILNDCSIDGNLDCIDEKTKYLALKYLEMGANKGDKTCEKLIREYKMHYK